MSTDTEATSARESVRTSDRPAFRVVLGLALRAGRRSCGLSQRALAERCGLSKSAVARIESGTDDLLLQTVCTALAVVGLRLDVVLDGDATTWNEHEHSLSVDLENVRDLAGRRPPAHLEPETITSEPLWRILRRLEAEASGRTPAGQHDPGTPSYVFRRNGPLVLPPPPATPSDEAQLP